MAKKEGTATLYEELDTREGEIKIYRIAKARQREREGRDNVNIIKNSEGKVVFKQEEVGEVWAEYFEELLNVENEGTVASGRPSGEPSTRDSKGRGRES